MTKNLFLSKVRRSFADAQDDIERNRVSASTHGRLLSTLLLTVTGFFDSLTGRCEAPCSACRKYFRHAGGLQKRSEAEQLAPVGVQRYGRARVAMEVKILAKQA